MAIGLEAGDEGVTADAPVSVAVKWSDRYREPLVPSARLSQTRASDGRGRDHGGGGEDDPKIGCRAAKTSPMDADMHVRDTRAWAKTAVKIQPQPSSTNTRTATPCPT